MLFEVVTIDLHYMTDRHKRFDLKISKLKLLQKQRHLPSKQIYVLGTLVFGSQNVPRTFP